MCSDNTIGASSAAYSYTCSYLILSSIAERWNYRRGETKTGLQATAKSQADKAKDEAKTLYFKKDAKNL